MRFKFISLIAGLMLISAPALASETSTAVSAAAGAAVGSAAAQIVNIGGSTVDCNAIPVKDLSSQDFANIKSACEALNKQPEGKSFEMTPEDVKEWGMLAKEFGSAIGATARELGVAVNDFLTTPAGVLITIYLFWSKLGGILIGVPFVLVIWYALFKWWNIYRRTPTAFEHKPVMFGLYNKKYVTEYKHREPDEVLWSGAIGGLITIAISSIIICTIIL